MKSEQTPFYIGLAGFGTVGGGLCELLRENADIVERRTGRKIAIKKILVRDLKKQRTVSPPPGASLTANMQALLDDPEISAIVELMGGIEPAKSLISNALARGKDVVTANKALLAEDSLELFEKAESSSRILRYEASVAGAIPVVDAIRESLGGNRVSAIYGILNGTSNYILSEMSTHGMPFEEALRQAQAMGFAEAEPSLDIDGNDAAHKLVVLMRLAFGRHYPYGNLAKRGIRDLSTLDITLARAFGYKIKLIGMAKICPTPEGDRIAAGVFPALVHTKSLLASVRGSFNALRLIANAAGPLFFEGKGAGALPTAGAVLSDIMAIARGDRPNNTGFTSARLPRAQILPDEEWLSNFYLRTMVIDEPGVLRDISACLAQEGISVAQMIQKEELASGVPLVFMTHLTSEGAMQRALAAAEKAGLLRESPVYFRILEQV